MSSEPVTRYAESAGASIAYQVVGEGPLDLVVAPGWLSHIDLLWLDRGWTHLIRGFASFARVILFDPRGTGLSDPIDRPLPLERRAEDLVAVLDAAGSERTALFGLSMGGPLSVMFAASHPDRTSSLILYGTYDTGSIEPDGTAARDRWIELMAEVRRSIDHWGEGRTVDWASPTVAHDPMARRGVGALERASFGPMMARMTLDTNITETDVRAILGSVRVPTLVLHRRDERIPVEYGRQLAAEIPTARFVELDGQDHLPTVGDVDSIIGEVEQFLTGVRRAAEPDRILATVLFTDIVDSTRRAAELGDRAWRGVLERHDEIVRAEILSFRGREIKHTGDGFLATFDGPARAVRCATTLVQRLRAQGIEIRCGVHTGECERRGDDIGGIAVHIGARIGDAAGPGEVLVSSTVKELVAGSGIAFDDRGLYALKGIGEMWRLFEPVGENHSVR
jgi:class 3 adenylate cyclase